MYFDCFLLWVVFLKLVFDFFFRRFCSAEWMQLEDKTFPSVGVSCLVSSSNLSKSSSSSESVLVLNASNSGWIRDSLLRVKNPTSSSWSTKSSNSWCLAASGTSEGFWSIEQLSKLPDPSAMKIQEPTRKEVPFSSTELLSRGAIGFFWRSLPRGPTVGASCRCFTVGFSEGYPEESGFE